LHVLRLLVPTTGVGAARPSRSRCSADQDAGTGDCGDASLGELPYAKAMPVVLYGEQTTKRLFPNTRTEPYVKYGIKQLCVHGQQSAESERGRVSRIPAEMARPSPWSGCASPTTIHNPNPHYQRGEGSFKPIIRKGYDEPLGEAAGRRVLPLCTPPSSPGSPIDAPGRRGHASSKQYSTGRRFVRRNTALTPHRGGISEREWFHMVNEDIISSDKWEYP